jgi:hypothetical protein
MWWLWIVGPLAAALVFLLTGTRDKRRDAEVEAWRRRMGPLAKKVSSIPSPFQRMVFAAGGGAPLAQFELVPKLAYLSAMGADAVNGSDHATVTAKLEDKAPTFTARPLPIIEGQRMANTGVLFKKDPDFSALFLVERSIEGEPEKPAEAVLDKAIRGWLSPPVRAALLDFPDAWLRVSGKAMSVTLYGPADADKLHELLTAADVIFAEYGADGGPSLLGDEGDEGPSKDDEPAPPPPPKKKDPAKKPAKSAKA